jgi:Mrp family chromosome partitioning ATPase
MSLTLEALKRIESKSRANRSTPDHIADEESSRVPKAAAAVSVTPTESYSIPPTPLPLDSGTTIAAKPEAAVPQENNENHGFQPEAKAVEGSQATESTQTVLRAAESLQKAEELVSEAQMPQVSSEQGTSESRKTPLSEEKSRPSSGGSFSQPNPKDRIEELRLGPGKSPGLRVFSADSIVPPHPPALPKRNQIRWSFPQASCEDYDRVVSNLIAHRTASRPLVLMFTSPGDGDGKTGLLTSLAPLVTAQTHREVLLVDADFIKGDLSSRLAVSNGGLIGLLHGEYSIQEVVCPTTIPHLSFLALGNDDATEEEEGDSSMDERQARHGTPRLFRKQSMRWNQRSFLGALSQLDTVLDNLKARYSIVLIDAPSLVHRHVATMGAYCDGVCLVVRTGYTEHRAVQEAAQVIHNAGGHRWGCIVIGH